jgi:hypothetical protein
MLAAAVLVSGPALAAPAFLPTRDVAVTYELNSPGLTGQDYRLHYDAADHLARIESPAQGFYVLANLPAGQAQIVLPALHAVVLAPDFSQLTQLIAQAGQARFTLLGYGSYAGFGCKRYLVLNAQGSGTACITHDGVVLHFSGRDAHGSAEVTAVTVRFAPEPAADFAAPAGYSAMTLPAGALAALLRP